MSTPLPPLYARWMEELLGQPLPEQPRSDCARCPQCGPAAPATLFRPGVKCCTYMPHLPAFRVGQILADTAPDAEAGRSKVRVRVQLGLGRTPMGVLPPPSLAREYAKMYSEGAFGTHPTLTCPYLVGEGQCGVWRHRQAVCATWFCRADRGVLGSRLYHAVRDLLVEAERVLNLWCAVQLGLPAAAIAALWDSSGAPRPLGPGGIPAGMDGQIPQAAARALWGPWHGREEAYYRACAERVSALSWADVAREGGVRLGVLATQVQAALAAWQDPALPPVLVLGAAEALPGLQGGVRLRTEESAFDPVEVPAALVDALGAFDGAPTDVVRARLQAQGHALPPELVRALYEHGILLAPDGVDLPPNARPTGPLKPKDRLAFFRGYRSWTVSTRMLMQPDGAPALVRRCGPREITLEGADGVAFGEGLYNSQYGFQADDACRWTPPGGRRAWPEVRDDLDALVAGELLVRLPR